MFIYYLIIINYISLGMSGMISKGSVVYVDSIMSPKCQFKIKAVLIGCLVWKK